MNNKRPLSPFYIYKPQLTAILSMTHRMTGIALAIIVLATSMILESYDLLGTFYIYHQVLSMLNILSPLIISGLLFMLNYHLFNGIRHLFWDMGYGYDMKTLYTTGYIVVLATIATTIGCMFIMYFVGNFLTS